MSHRSSLLFVVFAASVSLTSVLLAVDLPANYCEIQFIDAESERGIPLVLCTTTHAVQYVTDNAGRIAYHLLDGEAGKVFFEVETHGYKVPKDGFGISGMQLNMQPQGKHLVRLERINLAERLYRTTGAGQYRDSIVLGYPVPVAAPLRNAEVVGQDSVQLVQYHGKLHWFWGDTSRLSFPLGLFRTAGATSPLPVQASLPVSAGLNLNYFIGEDGFVRAMVDLPEKKGVVWIDGVCVVPDQNHQEHLVAHYSRRAGLAEQLEHGMLRYDDQKQVFLKQSEFVATQNWQHLSNHPVAYTNDSGENFLLSGTPFPLTRVPRNVTSIINPEAYQSWSCSDPDVEPKNSVPFRTPTGELDWRWRTGPPHSPQLEARWLSEKKILPHEAIISPEDGTQPGRRLRMHTGTVRWNSHRQKWIMIASEFAHRPQSPSHLGEVWYAEATSPQGPFTSAIKILSHNRQSFYNACQHLEFDEDGGRVIYFEGTYTNMFTNSSATPLYNYNQIMYRLDLNNPQLVEQFGSRSSSPLVPDHRMEQE